MPDPIEALDSGQRYERHGALDAALEQYRHAAESRDPIIAAEALRRTSSVLCLRSEWNGAIEAARKSAAVAHAAGLAIQQAEALNAEAAVFATRGELDHARPLFAQMLEITTDERTRGVALQNLASMAALGGDLATAEAQFRASSECFHRAGYLCGEAFSLTNTGAVALDRGDFAAAAEILERAVQTARDAQDLNVLAIATKNYAEALAGQGRLDEAEQQASVALGYFATTKNTLRQVQCYHFLGDIHERQGASETARSCYERGLTMARAIDARGEERKLVEKLGTEGRDQGPGTRDQG
jgi:tetratricopeptide (TPR) repeat protein